MAARSSALFRGTRPAVAIDRVEVSAYTVPTDLPESDGTLEWDKTTIVIAQLHAAGVRGLGYSYADRSAAALMDGLLAPLVRGRDVMDIPGAWTAMVAATRNLGRPGIVSMAISAVDIALWDLKARLLDLPLVKLLGAVREEIPIYGSGGFTSYSNRQLQHQLGEWASRGCSVVKMKIGRDSKLDLDRVRAARDAIGPETRLFVDANGAYTRKQALRFAEEFRQLGVAWFEEPVSSDDLEGLRLLRDRAPAGMDIAAGEYGYSSLYFRRMLEAGAVDVLQADATRCAGITGFLQAAALCQAHGIPLSAHTAPSIHAHPCCAAQPAVHLEYFHDHARIEHMFFAGVLSPVQGVLRPDLSRPGLGLEFLPERARAYRVFPS
ncbi:MAG TPA: enolase C-terminal domain-like protein [Terriglobales bacterium]|jgi:L-alanine-DL-glutamate epimerase-like enolase superfamily enzyme